MPDLVNPYQLVNYSGTLSANPPVTFVGLAGTRISSSVNYGTGSNSSISVSFSGGPGNLVWSGSTDNTWEIGGSTNNWLNGVSSDNYLEFDKVTFNDSPTSGNLSPVLNTAVLPSEINFDNSIEKPYVLSGTGSIGGAGLLKKTNSGTVTIAINNVHTGGTDVLGGILNVGDGGTTGSLGSGAIYVDGGTLSFNRTDTVTLNNSLGGTGSMIQNGGGTLALTGSTSFGGSLTGNSGVIQISDGSSNSPGSAVSGATSIAINTGGVLELPRLHALTIQTVNWSLPPVSLNTGSSLRFRATTGSNLHNITSDLAVSGSVTIDNNGGAYAQDINLSGLLSGSGTINYFATSDSGSAVTARTLSISGNSNSFNGNWFIDYTGSTTNDFVTLASGAPGALGTGTVTLDTRAQLTSSIPGGLDSLTEINLLDPSSTASFIAGWTNPSGNLEITNGTVDIGSGTSSLAGLNIASITQNGGTINLNLDSTSNQNDTITVSGNVDMPGGQIVLIPAENPVGKTYDILFYGGSLITPPFVSANVGRLVPTVSNGDGSNDKITVSFTGNSASLVWKGNDSINPNNWDENITQNWDLAGNPDAFLTYDNVTFNDSATSFSPSLIGNLNPGRVTINNSSNDYTLNGAGSIIGQAALVKTGTGTATINTSNSFTGNVTINGGKLVLGNAAALGDSSAGAKTITIGSGGQLDLNNYSTATPTKTYSVKMAGNGDGTGALINGSGGGIASNAGILNLELTDNATIGGTARFDIGFTASLGGTITGNGKTLTKTGSNQINLRGDASATPINIIVSQGTLAAENSDEALGGATGSVSVQGGTLSSFGPRSISTPVSFTSGSTLSNLTGTNSATSTWSGAMAIGGDITVNPNSLTINLDGILSGSGGITVPANGGTLNLTAANTFSGGLTVGPTSVTATTVNIGAASTLAVAAGKQVLVGNTAASGTSSQTLSVNGAVTNAGTLRVARPGILNINSGATWSQSGPMVLEGVGGYNATLNVGSGGTLTYSGTDTIKLNGATGNSGQALLNLTGTLTTSAGFEQTTAPTTGYGRITFTGGTLKLGANVPQMTTGVQFLLGTVGGTVDTNGFNTTIAANISGSNLTKSGAGTLTITGANTHTGTTNVNGGTLAGTGAASSVLSVASGATVAPGAGIGTFASAGATLLSGSTLAIEINSTTATADKLTSTTAVNIAGANVSFSEIGSGIITAGTELVILDYTGTTLTGTFNGLAEGATVNVGANSFTLSYVDSSRITLTSTTSGSPYAAWAALKGLDGTPGKNPAFDADPDGDGFDNGLEWILGGNPLASDAPALVTATATAAGGLTLNFKREEDSIGQAILTVEYDTDLAGTWTTFATVGATSAGPVTIDTAPDPDAVSVNIPASNAVAGKLFGRLRAIQP